MMYRLVYTYAKNESSAKGYSVFEGMNSGFIKFFCQTTRKGSAKKKKQNRQKQELFARRIHSLVIKHCAMARSEKTSPI